MKCKETEENYLRYFGSDLIEDFYKILMASSQVFISVLQYIFNYEVLSNQWIWSYIEQQYDNKV